jgi:nickel/cobalt exporter
MQHPFAVGANEGAIGATTGLAGWLLAQESGFYQLLTGAIRAAKQNGMASFGLIGLSFGYGVFHAAGPGHGKAVITSYMMANEKALRRGLIIALGAAILQGLTAIAIVSIAAIVLRSTARSMTQAAHVIETASYAGIMALGLALVFRKSPALIDAWRLLPRRASQELKGLYFTVPQEGHRTEFVKTSQIFADNGSEAHVHSLTCGHFHAPDADSLGAGFAWKTSLLTMVTAGARPCSGAILVLVFALSQVIYVAGLASVLAMSLGTALTTGALACFAVYTKQAATKWIGKSSWSSLMISRLFEVAAAFAVLIFGSSLFFAAITGAFGRG